MCGIAGFWDTGDEETKLAAALQALQPRGQDAAGVWTRSLREPRIAETPAQLFPLSANVHEQHSSRHETIHASNTDAAHEAIGHCLHAMVGFVPQPLLGPRGGILSANCELYTWRERAEKEGIPAANDADLLLQLLDALPTVDEHSVAAIVESLHGTFAFVYERDGNVVLARDRIGVKPLWLSTVHGLSVASTKQALEAAEIVTSEELSPRTIVLYDRRTGALHAHRRAEFGAAMTPTNAAELGITQSLQESLTSALQSAIEVRVPESEHTRTALFLGGGVDSAVLATVLGALPPDRRPHCYTVAKPNSREARAAAAIASVAGLPLTLIRMNSAAVERVLPTVLHYCDDSNPVQVSVGIVTTLASEAAAADGCTCAFSGVGADEVFASAARAQVSIDRWHEAVSSIRKIYERTLNREDALSMHYGVELRVPYLDEAVLTAALATIGTSLDTPQGMKQPLRTAAETLGVPAVIAELPRKSPQYGSGVMHALVLIAKRARKSSVAEYIAARIRTAAETKGSNSDASRSPNANLLEISKRGKRVAILLSGGKDSVLAAHIAHDMHYTLACAITIQSDNPDSYLYHTPNTAAAELQAQAMRIPFVSARTHGEPELELAALREALLQAKEEHRIAGVVSGAIGSHYQRERIEKICDELGLTAYSPLWQMNQLTLLRLLLSKKFVVQFTKVAAEGLDASWLGQLLTPARIVLLSQLQTRYGVHPAGEGGEYESLVLDAPLFRERLEIGRAEVIKDGLAGTLHIHDISLAAKGQQPTFQY